MILSHLSRYGPDWHCWGIGARFATKKKRILQKSSIVVETDDPHLSIARYIIPCCANHWTWIKFISKLSLMGPFWQPSMLLMMKCDSDKYEHTQLWQCTWTSLGFLALVNSFLFWLLCCPDISSQLTPAFTTSFPSCCALSFYITDIPRKLSQRLLRPILQAAGSPW